MLRALEEVFFTEPYYDSHELHSQTRFGDFCLTPEIPNQDPCQVKKKIKNTSCLLDTEELAEAKPKEAKEVQRRTPDDMEKSG